jgi:hypothetical protein
MSIFVKFVDKFTYNIYFYNKLDKIKMKFTKISFAALALLGYVDALNIKAYQGIGDMAISESEANIEAHRYINSKGEPINLSETQGHARIELTQ